MTMDRRGKKPPRPTVEAKENNEYEDYEDYGDMNVVLATEATGLFAAVPPPEVGAGAMDQLGGMQPVLAPDTSDREIEDLLKE